MRNWDSISLKTCLDSVYLLSLESTYNILQYHYV